MPRVDCAGLELIDGLDDGDVPLAALAIIKVMTGDGLPGYQVLATEGLTLVEGLGMAHVGVLQLTRALTED
jgi:hypothetical protein